MSTTQELLAANERYDALVKRIKAVAREWGIAPGGNMSEVGEDFAEAIRDSGAWRFARDLLSVLESA